jgi:hypothetical protein
VECGGRWWRGVRGISSVIHCRSPRSTDLGGLAVSQPNSLLVGRPVTDVGAEALTRGLWVGIRAYSISGESCFDGGDNVELSAFSRGGRDGLRLVARDRNPVWHREATLGSCWQASSVSLRGDAPRIDPGGGGFCLDRRDSLGFGVVRAVDSGWGRRGTGIWCGGGRTFAHAGKRQ